MEIVIAIIGACTSSGLTAILLAVLQHRWAKRDKRDAIVAALKTMMIDRVRHLGVRYIADNSISLADKENLVEMHRAYKALGGNGHLDTVMRDVGNLPIRDK